MRQLHPKAFWLFFLKRAVFLVFVLFLMWLPFLLTVGAYRYVDRVVTRPLGGNEVEGPYTGGFFGFILGAQAAFMLFLLFVVALIFVWAKLFYKSFRFELAKKGLKVEKGVVRKRYVIIPYERIQNVDIYRGVFERLLGLSDIHVQTAGYSAGAFLTEGRIPGLSPKDAEKLRDDLVDKIGKGQGL